MTLRDLQAFLEDDGLEYPVSASAFVVDAGGQGRYPEGKTYRVPSPDAKTGLWLAGMAEVGAAVVAGQEVSDEDRARLKLDDDDERMFYQRVLGSAYAEMLDDGLKWTVLQHIAQDAYVCFAMGQAVADVALMPGNRAARRARATKGTAKKTAGGRSQGSRASSGTASRTPRPASPASSTSPSAPEGQAQAV